MSPTRKPKPPDKGAPPEHKPSRKVALEEVMRSLQDLVSNELAIEPAKTGGTQSSGTPETSHTADRPEAVSDKLPQTVAEQPPLPPTESDSVQLNGLPDLEPAAPEATLEPPPSTAGTVPKGGLQQELPYLDAQSPTAADNAVEPAESPTASLTPDELPALTIETGSSPVTSDVASAIDNTDHDASIDSAAPPTAEATSALGMEINWDDIPVLEEAVDMAEESEGHEESGHARHGSEATHLPPADAARRLAVQVAARLNVELRKSGQDGLNSDIITRLVRLLQEALAKDTPNMENTTAMDGGSAGREAVPAGTNAGADSRPPPDKH